MAKRFFTTIIASGGFAGESFDINQGPAKPAIIDILLSNSTSTSASVLQEDSPVSLISTGILGGPRELDISNIENDGRFFYLSIQNNDIATNSLTITSSDTINGQSSLVISDTNDYVFVHSTGGIWRSQVVYTPEEKSNLELELEFKASQLTNFKELSYSGSNLTSVNVYTDITKSTLLFAKSLNYSGSRLDQTILTRFSDGATLTKNLTYSGSRLVSVETI